jgi:aryl-alcohol dehydrogenase-like predicted oxidoreductase
LATPTRDKTLAARFGRGDREPPRVSVRVITPVAFAPTRRLDRFLRSRRFGDTEPRPKGAVQRPVPASSAKENKLSVMERREFVKMLGALQVAANLDAQTSNGMIYRNLGTTGERVSALGLGGYHMGVPHDENESIRIVRSAIDRGITFLDNSCDYHDGASEIRMGKALKDGYRKRIFLMTKYNGRTRAMAAHDIDQSLRRMQVETIDLIQLHENIRLEDPDRFFAPGGALEAVMAAKKAGKVRYIGFTGHKDPAVHLRMLDVAAEHNFHFDSCQMPLNVLDYHFRSFAHLVVPRLVKEGIAVLGMKPMAFGNVLKAGVATPIECLHYALNLPTSVVISGCDSMERLDQSFEAVRTFKPLSEAQLHALVDKTKQAAMTGKFEPFKTTTEFDGTAQHPEWMG